MYDEEFKLPVFLTANNLKQFISSDLEENSAPIIFKDLQGVQSIGYKAELLPTVCYVFIDAYDASLLHKNQQHIADRCRILMAYNGRRYILVPDLELQTNQNSRNYERSRKLE